MCNECFSQDQLDRMRAAAPVLPVCNGLSDDEAVELMAVTILSLGWEPERGVRGWELMAAVVLSRDAGELP